MTTGRINKVSFSFFRNLEICARPGSTRISFLSFEISRDAATAELLSLLRLA